MARLERDECADEGRGDFRHRLGGVPEVGVGSRVRQSEQVLDVDDLAQGVGGRGLDLGHEVVITHTVLDHELGFPQLRRRPDGLASKVCGSVLGLDMIAETLTYLPPIWEMTLAYSFSAPTATICPVLAVGRLTPQALSARTPRTAAVIA